MQSEILIQSQIDQTNEIINQVEKLKSFDWETLTWRAQENSWNILECLAHLNLYGDYYLPHIEDKMMHSKTISDVNFESGFMGNYFAKSMLPKEQLNKMKTFKDKNPIGQALDKNVIDVFIQQQFKLLALLNQARTKNLNKIKISTSISRLIKLKLGDAFQFVINHQLRHISQIDRIVQSMKK